MGTVVLLQHLQHRHLKLVPEIRSSPTFFRIQKQEGQPMSHHLPGPTPGDISVPPPLPHQSPPAPAGTTRHPESAGTAAQPPPRLAWQKKEPTMCHNSTIVPRSHRAPSHPPRGAPRAQPIKGPTVATRVAGEGSGGATHGGLPEPRYSPTWEINLLRALGTPQQSPNLLGMWRFPPQRRHRPRRHGSCDTQPRRQRLEKAIKGRT